MLDGCNSHDWRVIFGLARFGGLRRCEVLILTWSDILWDVGKLRIDSPKTGLRFTPLWPELRPILEAAYDDAPEGSICVTKFREGANLGTQMNRVIEKAGVEVWPKTFVNLRATRRTELEKLHPHHVINIWMGHGSNIANKHYLQVTEEDWAAAISGGHTGGHISADQEASLVGTEEAKTKRPREKQWF